MVQVAPSPRDVLWHDGSASLYRFRRPSSVRPAAASPVLVVPSMINKWYVVDLRSGASLVEALVARRVATAEGRIVDEKGKLIAHGTTTCMILGQES